MRLLSLFFIIHVVVTSFCGAEGLSPAEIASQAKSIQEKSRAMSLEELLPGRQIESTKEHRAISAEILVTSQKFVEKAMAEEAEKLELENVFKETDSLPTITVFITLGEGPDYTHGRKMLNALTGKKSVQIALRGLPDGVRRINGATSLVRALAGDDFSKLPPVDLDPVKFKKYGITQSPTLVYERDGEEVARVSGQLAINYLRRKVEEDAFEGNLGVLGDTIAVVERDLIEEIKERVSQIDWVTKREMAKKRFWKKQKIQKLSAATEDRTFSIKPEFETTQNIYDHKGNVVIEKGLKINVLEETLKVNPRRFYLVVFDGSDSAQVKQAAALASAAPENHKTILITTALADLDHGWDELNRLQDQLGSAVFLLDERFVQTFGLQHVPCTVRPSDSEYIIQEYRREL